MNSPKSVSPPKQPVEPMSTPELPKEPEPTYYNLEPVQTSQIDQNNESDQMSINISDLNPNNLLNCSTADFEATINHLFQL